ncbi:hypothetical protein [Endozoicomonas sp. ALD040]|uniref:hypothetical protein n=1 Tax=Endozoicomonas sp. ALD040 TaxID=3403079 RepID=UPI003BB161CF
MKSIRHEGHSDLRGFTVNKHRKSPCSFNFKGAKIARLEKIHHPSVHLKLDASDVKKKIVECLVFKDLLKCHTNIIPTSEGVGVNFIPLASSKHGRVKMESKNGETIITFTGDLGSNSIKLHIGNDYWKHNNINELIGKYESMNLM